ncbi:MAG: hypothetical protein GY790_04620 [Bacteroidetes bacterium]|nr:hypothetical protein [Bacteroidota bacterium]
MKVLTITSSGILEQEKQTEVHFAFGMEKHTDYVFKFRGDQKYSATIVLEDSAPVVEKIISASVNFPDIPFVIDDLNMEENCIERYHIKDGIVKEQLRSGWKWGEES